MSTQTPTLNYLSAVAGSGKTKIIVNTAKKNLSGHIVIAVPSIKLADEVFAKLDERHATIIHSKLPDFSESVTSAILKTVDHTQVNDRKILVITQAAFLNLPYWSNKNQWTVYWDEAYDITSHGELNLKEHIHYITDVVSVYNKRGDYCIATIKKDALAKLNRVLNNKHADEFWEKLRNFYQDVKNALDDKCDIWIHNRYYRNLLDGHGQKFVYTAIYNTKVFEGFNQVVFAGAFFEKSLMYHLWQRTSGVQWTEATHLKKQLRFDNHAGKQVVFKCFFENRSWSKYVSTKPVGDTSAKDYFDEFVKSYYQDYQSEILDMANKDSKPLGDKFVACPFNNQGLNCFDHINKLVYRGAYNKPPAFYALMKHLGLEDIARWSLETSLFYQTILRSSLRTDSDTEVEVLVSSKATIENLLPHFPDARVEMIDAPVEFKKIDINTTQKDLTCRSREQQIEWTRRSQYLKQLRTFQQDKRVQQIKRAMEHKDEFLVDPILIDKTKNSDRSMISIKIPTVFANLDLKSKSPEILNKLFNILFLKFIKQQLDYTLKLISGVFEIPDKVSMTFFPHLKTTRGKTIKTQDVDTLFEEYKRMMNRYIESKDKNALCTAYTLKSGAESRRVEDIKELYGFFLDFDTENEPAFTGNDFQELFGPVRHIIHSTYSGGYRRRIFGLFNRPVSVPEYVKIMQSMRDSIMEHHPKCGLDESKLNPASVFYQPGHSGNANGAYCEEFAGHLFNVDEFLTFSVPWEPVNDNVRDRQELNRVIAPDEAKTFEDKVMPIVQEMKPHNRFGHAQRAVGVCKTCCPSMKARLFACFRESGLSPEHQQDMEQLWSKQ